MSIVILVVILLPLLISAFLWRHLFFRNKFSPPDDSAQLQICYLQGIPFLIENALPYPAGILGSTHQTISLDGDWNFHPENDPHIIRVAVPHCFNTAGSPLRDFEGAVFYEKEFTLPIPQESQLVRLAFLGSFYRTDVWLDDQLLGSHEGGYLPFYFDISPLVKSGTLHHITVRVDNRLSIHSLPQRLFHGHNVGWHPYGGLHRSVQVEICPAQYCFKLHVEPDGETGAVKVSALFHTWDKSDHPINSVTLILSAANRQQLSETEVPIHWDANRSFGAASHEFIVATPQAWEPKSPNLYRLEVRIADECCETQFGFRSIRVQNGKLILNGKPILLKGVCRHQEDREMGLAQQSSSVKDELNAIREMNGNFVRLAHYPHSTETLNLCDQMGLCAWTEIPLYQAGLGIIRFLFDKTRQNTGKSWGALPGIIWATRELEERGLMDKARNEMLKMIERDVNHPSVLFWGLGNECWTFHPSGAKAMTWLRAQAESLDASRLFGYAAFALPFLGLRHERAFEAVDVVGINEYFGWYYGKVEDATSYLNALSRKYPQKPLLITETGADAVSGLHTNVVPPPRGYSEEFQAWLLEIQWQQMLAVPTFSGLSIWVLKDFLCPEYRDDSPVPFYNLKGLLDRDSQPKLAYERMKMLYNEDNKIRSPR